MLSNSRPPTHRRVQSSPAPDISIVDHSTPGPLTNHEDPLDHRSVRPEQRRGSHARRRSPDVAWKKVWNHRHHPWNNGRVLVVDCFSRVHSDDGHRKTESEEFNTLDELKRFYEKEEHTPKGHALRIIHVQNAIWARKFLLEKFNVNHRQDASATPFIRWAEYDKPQRRGGKPVLNARSFRVHKDPWREVWRAGFGMDYLTYFPPARVPPEEAEFKLMELNRWDESDGNSSPLHGYDVYVQRFCVYLQRDVTGVSLDAEDWKELKNPYVKAESVRSMDGSDHSDGNYLSAEDIKTKELVDKFDNKSTIILFESSHSNHVEDTLVQARDDIEKRWRLLWMDLTKEDIDTDDHLALECMDLAITYILRGLHTSWAKLLSKCDEHVSILEEKIYENPADESRAQELWNNSGLWLKIGKLLSKQLSTLNEVTGLMKDLSTDEGKEWFRGPKDQLNGLRALLRDELVAPTTNLTDLMYKSVEIRDSRQELQLGTSMWRLSWITFIFLPLTFISGFFGMNVDLFQVDEGYPEIKWYFISAVPLMLLVVICYILIKRSLANRRADPVQRGIYESIFTDFSKEYPLIWSRVGPRSELRIHGLLSKIKWRLLKYWFSPTKTIAARQSTGVQDLSAWSRFKYKLANRWLRGISDETMRLADAAELGLLAGAAPQDAGDFGAVEELVSTTTPIALASAEPAATLRSTSPTLRGGAKRSRASRSSSRGRRSEREASPGASPGSEVMVCKEASDDERGEDDGKLKVERPRLLSRSGQLLRTSDASQKGQPASKRG